MANPYSKCKTCGSMWPGAQLNDHKHLTAEEAKKTLKYKYRMKKFGWNKAANPRTNSPKLKGKTLAPRRRAYGPFWKIA